VFVPSNSADLLYKAQFTTIAYVGASTILESNFEDLGYASIGITSLNVSLDFGLYEHHHDTTSDCIRISPGIGQGVGPCVTLPFLTIQPYQETSFPLTIQIPNNTDVGDHPVTATVSWKLSPYILGYDPPSKLVAHGDLIVYSKPSNSTPNYAPNILNGFLRFLPPIIGGSAIIVVLAVGLILWNGKKSARRNQGMLEYVASAKQSLNQKTCANCGVPAAFDARFCGNCGHVIS
jgi:hypothetical protein